MHTQTDMDVLVAFFFFLKRKPHAHVDVQSSICCVKDLKRS